MCYFDLYCQSILSACLHFLIITNLDGIIHVMDVSVISALNVSQVCKFLLSLASLQPEVLPVLLRKI
jgi:hypothetical protein